MQYCITLSPVTNYILFERQNMNLDQTSQMNELNISKLCLLILTSLLREKELKTASLIPQRLLVSRSSAMFYLKHALSQ